MTTKNKTLYEVEVLCPRCNSNYKEITASKGYYYRTCKLCGDYMAKRSWQSEVKEIIQEI